MIISDLNYLEAASEANNLVGGRRKRESEKSGSLVNIKLNIATVTQTATNVVIGGGKYSETKGYVAQAAAVSQS